jgi:hypothetical protein
MLTLLCFYLAHPPENFITHFDHCSPRALHFLIALVTNGLVRIDLISDSGQLLSLFDEYGLQLINLSLNTMLIRFQMAKLGFILSLLLMFCISSSRLFLSEFSVHAVHPLVIACFLSKVENLSFELRNLKVFVVILSRFL